MARRTPRPRKVNLARGPRAVSAKSGLQPRISSRAKAKGWARFKPKNVWRAATTRQALRWYGIAIGVFFLFIVAVFLWYARDLPSPNKINAVANAQTTKIYDRTGQTVLFEVYGDKNRSIIDYNQMPDSIKQATVAIEDKNFFKHGAFYVPSIFRAIWGVVTHNPSKGGGSTITQQYVKNALLTNQRTFSRKVKELILSIQLEQFYKKQDILKLYLNEIPYGSTAYGIQAAAKQYFNKDAKDLTLPESTLLAALPQAPTYYRAHPADWAERQHIILDKMVEQGYIKRDVAEAAKTKDPTNPNDKRTDYIATVQPYNPYANIRAPHFVQYVRESLEDKYGIKTVDEGGLRVITSLDLNKQAIAEQAIKDNMKSVHIYGGSNAAMMSEDVATGEVLAMVGSCDPNDPKCGSFNVTTARRQPGSSIKPIVYSNLFKGNWGPGSTLYDVQTDFGGGYKPRNYTGRFYGVVSLRQAFASSLNIPAVKAMYIGGLDNFLATAKSFGFTTFDQPRSDYGLSLALGSGEVKMTEFINAYTAFADSGMIRKQVSVLKVTDSSGKVLEENKPENNKPHQVIDPQIAYEVDSIISDNSARCSLGAFSCNNPLTLSGRPVAAKTGTTEDYRDAWTIGFTPRVITAVWAGNNDNSPMTQAASIVSAPIWHQYMQNVTSSDPVENFVRPSGIQELDLDAQTGRAITDSTKQKRHDIFASWYKVPAAIGSKTAVVNVFDGKLAGPCTPTDAQKTITAGSIVAEIPSDDPSYPRWEPPVAALAASLGANSGGSIPTETSTMFSCNDAKPNVKLDVNPKAGSSFNLTATVTPGKFTPTRIYWFVDGAEISDQAIGGGGTYGFSHKPGPGSHTYTATVVDSGTYKATSNAVTVTSNPGPTVTGSCATGTCTISISGGSPPYSTYLSYNNGTHTAAQSGANPPPYTGWPGGPVVAYVTDQDGTYDTTINP